MRGIANRRSTAAPVAAATLMVLLAAVAPSGGATVIRVPADAPTLDEAVAMVPDGGVIELSPGTYNGGFAYNNLGKGFTIRAAAIRTAALDGGGIEPVFQLHNTDVGSSGPLVFEGLVFRNGVSTINGVAGGVTLSRAEAAFFDCLFEGNDSSASTTGGGGMAVVTSSYAFLVGCEFRDNTATNEAAGLRVSTDSVAVVFQSQFSDNLANVADHRTTAAGGGIHVGNADLLVADTRFEGNQAGYVGGGLYAIGSWQVPMTEPRTTVVVSNCSFVENRAEAHPSVTTPSPPEGGAVHAENQALLRIYSSRFFTNTAEKAGAVSSFRSRVEVQDSVFRGNRVEGSSQSTGFGGAIAVVSNDTTADGSINRPVGELVLNDTLIQGRWGTTGYAAQTGGGVYLSGDKNREFGYAGVVPLGPTSANRAPGAIDNVVFYDCDVTETPEGGRGIGGGVSVELGSLAVTDSAFLKSDAVGSESTAGALRFVIDSVGSVLDSTFADNSAEAFGGAVFAQGSDLDLVRNDFLRNVFSRGVSEPVMESYGAAIFTGPLSNFSGNDYPMEGAVANNDFGDNEGLPIFDADLVSGPINDVIYNINRIHSSTFGSDVYRDALVLPQSVSELNALIVTRGAGVPSSDKSTQENQSFASVPTTAMLRAVPSLILPAGAAGDPVGETSAFLGWSWSGASAWLNGVPLAANTGLSAANPGVNTLQVDGQQLTATVVEAEAPEVRLVAQPDVISRGQPSILSWNLSSGWYLGMELDQAVRIDPALKGPTGSVEVYPNVTTTYRVYVVTREGGAVGEVTVWVDESPAPVLFQDDFESGTTGAWSTTVP